MTAPVVHLSSEPASLRWLDQHATAHEVSAYVIALGWRAPELMPAELVHDWHPHVRSQLAGSRYQLAEVALASVGDIERDELQDEWLEDYRGLSDPPAVVFCGHGEGVALFDGRHRLQAARERGDNSIRAWLPTAAS